MLNMAKVRQVLLRQLVDLIGRAQHGHREQASGESDDRSSPRIRDVCFLAGSVAAHAAD